MIVQSLKHALQYEILGTHLRHDTSSTSIVVINIIWVLMIVTVKVQAVNRKFESAD